MEQPKLCQHLTSDSTGTTYTKYTPDQIGNYSMMVVFEQLYWRWSTVQAQVKTTMEPPILSSNRTYIVQVQQDPIAATAITSYPLPTEYWTRPIEGQR